MNNTAFFLFTLAINVSLIIISCDHSRRQTIPMGTAVTAPMYLDQLASKSLMALSVDCSHVCISS